MVVRSVGEGCHHYLERAARSCGSAWPNACPTGSVRLGCGVSPSARRCHEGDRVGIGTQDGKEESVTRLPLIRLAWRVPRWREKNKTARMTV